MKKVLVLSLAAGIAAAAAAGSRPQPGTVEPRWRPAEPGGLNIARYKMALTDARKQALRGRHERADAAAARDVLGRLRATSRRRRTRSPAARVDLAKKYADNFQNVSDADITSLVTDSANLQKKTIDLRVKYYGILSQKINAHAAGRFALIDDYTTTAARLNLLNQLPIPTGDTDASKGSSRLLGRRARRSRITASASPRSAPSRTRRGGRTPLRPHPALLLRRA